MESKSIIFTYALIIKVEPKFHFFKDFAVLSFRYELKAKKFVAIYLYIHFDKKNQKFKCIQ